MRSCFVYTTPGWCIRFEGKRLRKFLHLRFFKRLNNIPYN